MAPMGSQLSCNFSDARKDYAHCHRYDQSLITVLRTQMLFLDGYYERLTGDGKVREERAKSPLRPRKIPSLAEFERLVAEWDERIHPFAMCLQAVREDKFNGSLPMC